jgi:hypothetical protein
MHPHTPEGRQKSRKAVTVEFCPVLLEQDGRNFGGFLVDISGEGARIKIPDEQRTLRLHPNEELQLNIRTPYGPSAGRAQVRWTQQDERAVDVGLRFMQIPNGQKRPIQELMGDE